MAARRKKRRRNNGRRRRNAAIANPRRRRRSRRNPRRRRNRRSLVRSHYRRNPRAQLGQAFIVLAKGALGGLIGYGLDWGASYAPVNEPWGSVIFAAGGTVVSVGMSMLVDTDVGAGIAGATAALLVGRIRRQMALRELKSGKEEKKNETATTETETAGVRRRRRRALPEGAGRVFNFVRDDAGQVTRAVVQPAPTLPGLSQVNLPGMKSFKHPDAGSSRYSEDTGRRYGPANWIQMYRQPKIRREAGRVIRVVGIQGY